MLFSSTQILYIVMDLMKNCNFTLSGEWKKYKRAKSLIYHNENLR